MMKPGRKIVVIVLIIVFSAALGAELVVRLRDTYLGYGFFSSHRNQIANIKPLLPFLTFGFPLYKKGPDRDYILSRHGEAFPLKKDTGTLRVVALGGSTTECGNLIQDHHTHYPLLLQEALSKRLGRSTIEVINVGNAGYATPHTLILLMLHVISWEPDIVILSENVNDLMASYFPDFKPDYANKYSHEFFGFPNMKRRLSLSNQLFRHSQLYWSIKEISDLLSYTYDNKYKIQRQSLGNSPSGQAMQIFKRNIKSFIAIARSRGISVVIGTQPLQDSEEMFVRHHGFKPYNNLVSYPLHGEFVSHHKAFNRILRETAVEEKVYLVDNDLLFGNRKELFADYVHYSLEGATVLANNYADSMIASGLVR